MQSSTGKLEEKEAEFFHRVDPKIVIHTGLRNTYAGTTKYAVDYPNAQIPSSRPAASQMEAPVTRETVLATKGRRNPINSRMVRPGDVLTIFQNRAFTYRNRSRRVPGETMGRHTFEAIRNQTVKQYYMFNRVLDRNQGALADSTQPGLKPIKGQLIAKEGIVMSNPGPIYKGAPGTENLPSYSDDRLTTNNPSLATKLASMFNYPSPFPDPLSNRVTLEELVDRKRKFDRLEARSLENSDLAVRVNASLLANKEKENSKIRVLESAPSVQIVYNGQEAEIPSEINCNLCHSAMRFCIRKWSYKGEIREYPAYRCLRRGCQTFRSVRKVMKPEYSKFTRTPNEVSYRSIVSDRKLDILMQMPERRELGNVKQEEEYGSYSYNDNQQEVKEEPVEESGWNKLDEMINAHVDDDQEGQEDPFVKQEPVDDYEFYDEKTAHNV